MGKAVRVNPLVYQAIIDAYQQALVKVLRAKLSVSEIRQVFKPEAIDGFFTKARDVGRDPTDIFEVLDVPNANRVVAFHVSHLLRQPKSWTQADNLHLMASLRRIVEARHWVAHSTDTLPRKRAEEALQAAVQVLYALGSRSRRLDYLQRQLILVRPVRHRLPPRKHQLPPVKPMFGRGKELKGLTTTLGNAAGELVTLRGEGGIGKTRLALEVAYKFGPEFPGGASWVPLADESSWQKALPTIAAAIGIGSGRFSDGVVERITKQLSKKPILLVLDNLEHLVSEARADLSRMARECRDSRILVTSRESIGAANERVYVVTGLALPRKDDSLGDLQASPSVAMFVERARRANNLFNPTSDEYGGIGELCRKVHGVPLAIELLASGIGDRTVRQLASEWAQVLEEVKIGKADRHASMRASFRWSWSQLNGPEQETLRSLSLLWPASLATIVEICSPKSAAEDAKSALRGLVRKSLITIDGEIYDLHPLVRLYASAECSAEVITATWKVMLTRASTMLRAAKGDFASEPDLANALIQVLVQTELGPELDSESLDFWLAYSDHWEVPGDGGELGPYVLKQLSWLTFRVKGEPSILALALIRAAWLAENYDEHLYAACAALRALRIAVQNGHQQVAVEAAGWIGRISFGKSPVFVEGALRELVKHRGSRLAAAAAGHLTWDWDDVLMTSAEEAAEGETESVIDQFDGSLAARARSVSARLWLEAGDAGEALRAREEVARLLEEGVVTTRTAFAETGRMFRQAGDASGESLCQRKLAWWILGLWGDIDPRDLIALDAATDQIRADILLKQTPTSLSKAETRFEAALALEVTPDGVVGLSYVLARRGRFDDAWRALGRIRETAVPISREYWFGHRMNLHWIEHLWKANPRPSTDVIRGVLSVVTPSASYLIDEGHPLSGARIVKSCRQLLRSTGDPGLLSEFAGVLTSLSRQSSRGLHTSERRAKADQFTGASSADRVEATIEIAVREILRQERRVMSKAIYL